MPVRTAPRSPFAPRYDPPVLVLVLMGLGRFFHQPLLSAFNCILPSTRLPLLEDFPFSGARVAK